MASLGQNPNYRALASAAAAELGSSSPSIVAAILGQWTCEQRGPWPPTHNNPGFVTIGALRSVGVLSGTPATTSPGINFLAAFGSPGEGASAYAQLLARGRRYAPVRAAVAAGDGAAFLQAVTSAGYGTRYSCAIGAYKALGGKVAPSTSPTATLASTPAESGGRSEAEYYARIASIGISIDPAHAITADEAARMATELYKVAPDPTITNALTGRTNRELAAIYVAGETIPTGPVPDIGRAIAAAGAAIGEAIGQGVFSVVVLGGILVLGVMGIRRLTG